jgi:hypothetical protein
MDFNAPSRRSLLRTLAITCNAYFITLKGYEIAHTVRYICTVYDFQNKQR